MQASWIAQAIYLVWHIAHSLQWPLWIVSNAAIGISQSINPRWSAANTITRAEPDTMASYFMGPEQDEIIATDSQATTCILAWLQASTCMIANFMDSPKTLQQC